jgi:hypothetical protein
MFISQSLFSSPKPLASLFVPPAAQPQRAPPDIALGLQDLALEAVVVLTDELI